MEKIKNTGEFGEVFQVVNSASWQKEDARYAEMRRIWDDVTQKHYVTDLPLHVDIEVTNDCNLHCAMCERRLMKRPVGYMEMGLYRKIIDYCADMGILSVKLNLWGESVLHPKLGDMVRYAKERGIVNTQFNTNASLLTEDKARELVNAGLDRLTLSVDSLSKGTYERIRVGSDIDKVNRNIETMLQARKKMGSVKPYITAQIIRMKGNEEGVRFFVDTFSKRVDYVSVTNIGAASGDPKILRFGLLRYHQERKFPCPEIWHRLSISHDGDVTVCCQDYDFELKIGNVEERTIKELWHSAALTRLRERHQKGDYSGLLCAVCTANCEAEELNEASS